MFNALIIDDEVPQQQILTKLLKDNFPSYSILDCCSSVEEAFKKITLLKPQLVFLDVVMHPLTGFDLLQQLPEISFEIIFTTSYSEYALKAIKISAIDYIIKPVSVDELGVALQKFESKTKDRNSLQHIELLLHNLQGKSPDDARIALATRNGFVFVKVNDIIRCEADNYYTIFILNDNRKLMVSKTIKEAEEVLSEYNFCRVHQSHLINLKYVKEYVRGEGGLVKMNDGSHIDVARRKKDDFLKMFKKL